MVFFGKLFLASNPCKSNNFSQNIWNRYTKRHLNPVTTFAGDISLRVTFSQVLMNSASATPAQMTVPLASRYAKHRWLFCRVWERTAQISVNHNADQVPGCQTTFKHRICNLFF